MTEIELIRLRHQNGVIVPRLDHTEARELAISLLKKAGFELHQVSKNSTSAYYKHPARAPLLLRVADHSSKKAPLGLSNTVAKLTISTKDQYLTDIHVCNLVATSIGKYFLNDPKPSVYENSRS